MEHKRNISPSYRPLEDVGVTRYMARDGQAGMPNYTVVATTQTTHIKVSRKDATGSGTNHTDSEETTIRVDE